MGLHAVLGLLLGLALVAGLTGLGRRLGARDLPAAAVIGLTVTWWPAALLGVALGPRAAAAAALTVPAAALPVWFLRCEGRREALFLLGAVAAGAPVWLAPPVFYDSLVYHLGMPWSWLANGSIAPVPHNLFSHFPLAASVIFLGPVRLGLPEAAAGVHWAAMVLAAAAAAGLARRLGAGSWAWLAAAATLGCWHGLWVGGFAAADWFVVLGVTVAASEVVGMLGAGSPGRPWLAGLGLGLALATKYTAAVPVAGLLAAFVAVRPRAWRRAVATGAVALLSSAFWFFRNAVTTGNPVYPLLWRVFGGRGWDAAQNARYLAAVRAGAGGPLEAVAGLGRLPGLDRGLGPWFLAAAVLLAIGVASRRRTPALAWTAVASAGLAVGWAVTSQLPRFALPLAPLLGAGAAAAVAGLGRRAARPAAAAVLTVACLVGAGRWVSFAFGTEGLGAWWRDREGWRHAVTLNDPLPAFREAGRRLPRDARILLVGEARSFGCPRPHHASSARDVQLVQAVVERSRSADEVAGTLRREGFTHLLIAWGEIQRLHAPPAAVLLWRDGRSEARWWTFLERWTAPVGRVGTVEIRRLRAAAGLEARVPEGEEPGTMRPGQGQGGDHDREDP